MRGVKKKHRARVEFLDEFRWLTGSNQAANPDLFANESDVDLYDYFKWSWRDMGWAPRSIVRILLLTKAGIPQKEWHRERAS